MLRICLFMHIAWCMHLNADTLMVTTYNILNFPDALGTDRLDDMRCVLGYIGPDVLIVQEMESQTGVDLLRDSVLNVPVSFYESVPFHDGPDTDNALFYRSDRVECLSSRYLQTVNRDIAEYRLYTGSGLELYVYSVHLKSSPGDTNELLRLQEATVLRYRIDSLGSGANVIVAGDFNFYSSAEPGFSALTQENPHAYSRLYDPLFLTGSWHDNEYYAAQHTQSTRDSTLPDGGAGGGLDDRFDMVLCSESMLERDGVYLDPSAYSVCGNDGEHFDRAVNEGLNTAVPVEVADALYFAADHLPVSVCVVYRSGDIGGGPTLKIWPNPADTEARIGFPWHDLFIHAQLDIIDITGRSVFSHRVDAADGFILPLTDFAVGVYFVTVTLHTVYSTYTYHAKLAVTK